MEAVVCCRINSISCHKMVTGCRETRGYCLMGTVVSWGKGNGSRRLRMQLGKKPLAQHVWGPGTPNTHTGTWVHPHPHECSRSLALSPHTQQLWICKCISGNNGTMWPDLQCQWTVLVKMVIMVNFMYYFTIKSWMPLALRTKLHETRMYYLLYILVHLCQ